MAKSFKRVGAVDNAMAIISHLAGADRPLKLTQISRDLGINGSTCLNILRTLESHGMVSLDPRDKTYVNGPELLNLAKRSTQRGTELDLLLPIMESIAGEFAVHVSLWRRLDPDHLTLVLAAESSSAARIAMTIGQRRPVIYGAMGRVISAFAEDVDEAYVREHFDGLRWAQPLQLEAYLKQVSDARRRGWALDKGNAAVGLQVISAPIFGRDNRIHSVSGVTTFVGELDSTQERLVADRLKILGDVLRKPYDPFRIVA
ncbi:MAG TPA: helix-turn-helix domain-containing protein [Phenylobacterium sp.]